METEKTESYANGVVSNYKRLISNIRSQSVFLERRNKKV